MRYYVLLMLAALALAGCGRIQNERFTGAAGAPNGVEVTIEVAEAALKVGELAEAEITVYQDGEPVRGAALAVEGNMSHAGMEPIFVEAIETAPGEYRAPLEWTMGGEWILTVRGTLPDGSAVEERLEGLTVES